MSDAGLAVAGVALAVEILGAGAPLQVAAGSHAGLLVAELDGGQDAHLLQELHLLLRGPDSVTQRQQVVPSRHFSRLQPKVEFPRGESEILRKNTVVN